MKKKHNDFFKFLQADVELQSENCKKAINQLRTYKVQIDKDWPYADKKLYKNMTKKMLFLQQIVSNSIIVKNLRCMQSEYHRKFNQQQKIQWAEMYTDYDGDEFEYD